ncbi:MAG TPA: hypothetical protein VEH27_15580 [Methylomirabilota bacterium]|nr:hypothetical protein [Methylomirabilota bacterium]
MRAETKELSSERRRKRWPVLLAVAVVLALASFVILRVRDVPVSKLETIRMRQIPTGEGTEVEFKFKAPGSTFFTVSSGTWKETFWIQRDGEWVETEVRRIALSMPTQSVTIIAPDDVPWKYELTFSLKHVFPLGRVQIPLFTTHYHGVSDVFEGSVGNSAREPNTQN